MKGTDDVTIHNIKLHLIKSLLNDVTIKFKLLVLDLKQTIKIRRRNYFNGKQTLIVFKLGLKRGTRTPTSFLAAQ